VIVDGAGMIGRAFQSESRHEVPALIFARGVADSASVDETAYARERTALAAAIVQARDSGRTLVYLSAAPAYGRFGQPVSEQTPLKPLTRYGHHKADSEREVIESGIRHLILRLPNVVGSGGNEHQLIPRLTSQILQGEVTVFRTAGRDLIHVRDLVRLTMLLLGRTTGIVNVASGICTPSGDIVRWLIELLGVQARVREIDAGEQQHFDTSLLRGLLGDEAAFSDSYPQDVLKRYVATLNR
jgi:nucleoside-diphosphate-sugar epimerase